MATFLCFLHLFPRDEQEEGSSQQLSNSPIHCLQSSSDLRQAWSFGAATSGQPREGGGEAHISCELHFTTQAYAHAHFLRCSSFGKLIPALWQNAGKNPEGECSSADKTEVCNLQLRLITQINLTPSSRYFAPFCIPPPPHIYATICHGWLPWHIMLNTLRRCKMRADQRSSELYEAGKL